MKYPSESFSSIFGIACLTFLKFKVDTVIEDAGYNLRTRKADIFGIPG
jgi:hypothetical protein